MIMTNLSCTEYVLGLDLGTSSCKVSAVSMNGQILGSLYQEYRTATPEPGWSEQQPSDWINALAQTCKKLLTHCNLNGHLARGLSVTCAAHILVLLDKSGEVIRPAILWNDQRSTEQAARLSALYGQNIFSIAGNWPSTTWSLPHLLWIKENDPDSWNKIHRILPSKDYVGYRLTGKLITDPATAVSTMLYDISRDCWSRELCDFAHVQVSQLPDIHPIGTEVGTLNLEGARLLGLGTQTRVYNGTLDSTAETFAAGVRQAGDSVIRLASAGGIHAISKKVGFERKLISYPYITSEHWFSQAGTSCCATAVSWAARLFMEKSHKSPDFNIWNKIASQSQPGAKGVFFHPYLAGERCPYWEPALRGSFTGLALNHTQADLARAVYEGTVFSLLDAAETLTSRGSVSENIKVVGGGGRSELWCQILSDVFNRPVDYMAEADSSFGAAIISLCGTGIYKTFESVPINLFVTEFRRHFVPNADTSTLYKELYEQYRYISHRLLEIAKYKKG